MREHRERVRAVGRQREAAFQRSLGFGVALRAHVQRPEVRVQRRVVRSLQRGFAQGRLRARDIAQALLRERAKQTHRAAPAVRKREESIGNGDDLGMLLALEKDVGEIRERLGMPGLDAECSPVALLGAVDCPEHLVAEAEVVEDPDMIGKPAQRALVVDRRCTVFGMTQIVVAQVKRGLGVVRIDIERPPPGLAGRAGVYRHEAFAEKIPGGDIVGVALEQATQQGFGILVASRHERELRRLERRAADRGVGIRAQSAVAVLVALAAAAGAGRVARDRGRVHEGRFSHAARRRSSRARLNRAMSKSGVVWRLATSRLRMRSSRGRSVASSRASAS